MSDSDSDEEKTIAYGTPLDPIEEDEIPSKRKFQQAPDQYAVDAHGRRRFHGAFMGGFSAGYGNTVGTPEGWTPAVFKSSRSEKASVSAQRPEDFMDEEDRDEFGIAPRHLQTRGDFAGQKRQRQRYHDGPIPGEPVLSELLSAVHETAAVRMLRAMGWRPGQGTGDRVSKTEKRKQKDQHKVYGCYMPPEMRQNSEKEESQSSSDSEFEYDTLFAPEDYEPYVLQRKIDRFGLGYSGLSRHSVLGNLTGQYGEGDSKSHLVMKEKGKKVSIRGQAFGVGAFEADDEDIYAKEDMSHYDFAIGGAEIKQKKPANKERGVNVLEGFVKAKNPIPPVPSHPPPALPRDYRPSPASAKRTRFEPTTAPERDQGLGRHELTAEARGALLGEAPIPKLPDSPPPTPTIPDPPPPEDPIAKLLGRNVNFVSNEPKELDFIPIKDTGNEIPKTFKPFASIPEKQARYDRYLKDKEAFLREGDSNMGAVSEWERNRELAEFEQAAKLYRPLTGFMGDRFTHASEPDDSTNPLKAVTRSNTSYGLVTPEQVEAANKGVYGVMTRKEVQWNPESLVCKRFNIPLPGGVRSETKKEDKPKVSYSIFSYMESVHDKDSFAAEQHKFSGSRSLNLPTPTQTTKQPSETNTNDIQHKADNPTPSTSSETPSFTKRMTVAELFMKESEKDLKSNESVNETIEKFDKMDLYKAIFLSDSEDEDATPKPKDTTQDNDVNPSDFIEKPANIERNTSPPRGIFANVDFDELNSWRRNITVKTTDKTEKEDSKTAEKDKGKIEEMDTNSEADVYGPKIPETLQKRLEAESVPDKEFKPVFRRKTEDIVEIESSSSDSWVDVKEVKDKKLKKKKKKHKTKHKKSKHKKKNK